MPRGWTFDIQPQPAKQFGRGIQAKAAAFEPLDETAGLSSVERVEDLILPVLPDIEEGVKTMQAGRFDLLDPALESGLGGRAIQSLVKDSGQQRAQHVGAGQSRDLLKQRDDFSWLIRIQRPPFPTQPGPQRGGGYRPLGGRSAWSRRHSVWRKVSTASRE